MNRDTVTRAELARVERQVATLRGQTPVRISQAVESILRLQIIGGNVLSGSIVGIKYAASVTPLAVYDPDVTTSYPDGLGNAWLYLNGVRQINRVLVRHNFTGYTQPLVSGRVMSTVAKTTLTYSGTDMLCYLVDFP